MEGAVKKGPGASDEQFALNILDFVFACVFKAALTISDNYFGKPLQPLTPRVLPNSEFPL